MLEEIKEELKKPKVDFTEINKKLNENKSQIELAKDKIIDTIKASENEICSDIIRKTKELKEDNVITRNLVRQKAEKIDKNVSKLSDRQDQTDKMIEDELKELKDEFEEQV